MNNPDVSFDIIFTETDNVVNKDGTKSEVDTISFQYKSYIRDNKDGESETSLTEILTSMFSSNIKEKKKEGNKNNG
jgi:hypothetical protein